MISEVQEHVCMLNHAIPAMQGFILKRLVSKNES